jgi:GNAT superfamily N-acetyltransferase
VLRLLDPLTAPDETLHWMYDLRTQAQQEVSPDELPESRESFIGRFRHPVTTGRHYTWVIGGVGYATLDVDDGSTDGYVRLHVGASHRRRGAGRQLADALVHQARAVGCTGLTTMFGTDAGAGLVAALGARRGVASIRSTLTMPTRVSVEIPDGFSVRSWRGHTPDELLDTVAQARQAIVDAPFEGGVNLKAWTPRKVREVERAVAARGQELWLTVVLAGDRAVAVTVVRADPDPGTTAFIEDSVVVRDHRARGLGLAVKAESLRVLARERPSITRVSTFNHETNTPILAINRRLGFVPVSRWTSAYMELKGREPD